MRVCQMFASAFLANLTALFQIFPGEHAPGPPRNGTTLENLVPPEKIFLGASRLEIGAPRR